MKTAIIAIIISITIVALNSVADNTVTQFDEDILMHAVLHREYKEQVLDELENNCSMQHLSNRGAQQCTEKSTAAFLEAVEGYKAHHLELTKKPLW